MHLERLNVEHFRCFKKAALPFAKLTILTGPNSGGKSSLLAGALAALQSPSFPLIFSSHGKFVDLGDHSSIVYRHQHKVSMAVSLQLRDDTVGSIELGGSYGPDYPTGLPRAISVSLKAPFLTFRASERRNLRFAGTFTSDPTAFPGAKAFADESGKKFMAGLEKLFFESMPMEKTGSGPRVNLVKAFERDLFPRAASGQLRFPQIRALLAKAKARNHWLGAELEFMTAATRRFDTAFNYISSFRYAPARVYSFSAQPELKAGRYGDNAVQQIAAWQNEASAKLAQLARFLRKLTLVSKIETRRLRGGRFELIVRPFARSAPASLPDVGFGISQFLPIAVADTQLSRGSTLAVSQPEIHLHPSVQAALANVLTERINTEDRRYVVETHSEYFLNRVRLLIAEGRLTSDEVSVVYVENEGADSAVSVLRFESNGRISGAPKSFFETYMMDVMNLALKAQK